MMPSTTDQPPNSEGNGSSPESILTQYFEATKRRSLTTEEEQDILRLCREHPHLVFRRFKRHHTAPACTPLACLLHTKASLEIVQAFCEAYPQAFKQSGLSIPSLCAHSAHTRQPGVVACLVNNGNAPRLNGALAAQSVRALLSGPSSAALVDVKGLVEKYFPNGFPSFVLFVSILQPAMAGQNSPEVLNYITTRPTTTGDDDDDNELSIANWRFSSNGRLTREHGKALAAVFSRVKSLEIELPPRLDAAGWDLMLQALANDCARLTKLTIRIRSNYPDEVNRVLLDFLGATLTTPGGFVSLESLWLEGNAFSNSQEYDLTDTLASFLTHMVGGDKRLAALRVVRFRIARHEPIVTALQSNTHLENFSIPKWLDTTDKLRDFLHVVKRHNTTIQRIHIADTSVSDSVESQGIQFYGMLNTLGRGKARLSTIGLRDFVNLLCPHFADRLHDSQNTSYYAVGRLPFLYALLRENPSTWCGALLISN